MRGLTISILLCLLLRLGSFAPSQQPVIGIYTLEPDSPPTPFPENHTYLPASYFKNMEMAGAQVIPLYFHYNQQQLRSILGQINGVFFPGGEEPIDMINQWTKNIKFIVEYAKQQNLAGNPYPIWGTCLGYQALMYVTSGQLDNTTVITGIQDQNEVVETLNVYYKNSKLLATLNPEEYQAVTTGRGVFFYHQSWSVLKETFDKNQVLSSFWNLVATSFNDKNVEQIALVEAKQFPFFGSQFHAQKNNFEFRVDAVRSYVAIKASQKFANYFVNVARKNKNTFRSAQDLKKRLIYNYDPIYLDIAYPDLKFVQIYEFDESNLSANPYGYVSKQ